MKKLRLILIIIAVIICVLIAVILGLNNTKDTENNINNNMYNYEEINTINFEKIKDENLYYTVKAAIQKFYNYVYEKDTDVVLAMLDNAYIKQNSITSDNLYSKLQLNAYKKLNINEMYVYNDYIYVNGNLASKDTNMQENNIYVLFKLDKSKNIFSITPLSKEIYEDSIRNNKIYDTDKLEINSYNTLTYQNLSDHIISNKYLEDYRDKIQNNIEEAYNRLNKEYRDTRFKTLDNFKTYVNENISTIKSAYVNKYIKTDKENYVEYVCVDKYNNYYIFEVTGVMEYTLKLDTYTIKTEEFKKEYNSANVQKKVAMNAQIFIQMLNSKDYENAYNLLADGFKNNYFKTLDSFKQYAKNHFFEYNNVEFEGFNQNGSSYIYNVNLTDATNRSAGIVQKNIIMQLKDNMEFVMSFNV